ncbi:MAG TPA: ribosome small subunit-dependent GTPase A [Vicinamibacterales bacterium]|nr:ribosome small subunit-dependent GTPase A [Vicinamibacterales bacterium]
MDLSTLGWDQAADAAFGPHREQGLVPGRVSLEHNHIYRVMTGDGERLAEAAGRIKYLASGRNELPAVGDWVAVRLDARHEAGTIRAILPRRTCFSRKAAGRETEEQVIAANVDVVLIVFGLDSPSKPRAIERYIALARQSHVAPVVVLNKYDLAEDVAGDVAEITPVTGDVPVHAVSAATGIGLDALASYLRQGVTLAVLGPSGAGKSSLVNRLIGAEALATGEVRDWDARGRHTSVHRQMLVMPGGGVIIDTPGMRELQMWDAEDGVGETFEEIAARAGECRFRDCRHDAEPGCAVKAAVASGDIPEERYAGYMKLSRELEASEKLRDERALLDAKRQARIGSKAMKALQKNRGRA